MNNKVDQKLLYFGYGSNLNFDQANKWGLSEEIFKPVFPAYLPDNSLNFNYFSKRWNGAALNITPNRGHYVTGYVYEIVKDALDLLDQKEGHPHIYCREKVVVLDIYGNEFDAFTYRVVPEHISDKFEPPNQEYFTTCEIGRNQFSISLEQLYLAAKNDKPRSCNFIFLYGTLMPGELNCGIWRGHRTIDYIEPARTNGILFDHGNYPGLSIGGEKYVRGDVIEFYDINTILDILDTFEGFKCFGNSDNLFRRTLLKCQIRGGRTKICWTYATTRFTDPIIKTYDWRNHKISNFDKI